jgi:PPK2 family polyphosphate:nucleotide phosphotransferase
MKLEPVKPGERVELRDKDAEAPKSLPKGDELKEKTEKQLEKLSDLQSVFNASAKHSLLIILQGRDASGKDGVLRTVVGAANPAGVRVNSFKAPTPVELAHDYLWRIHQVVPEKGMFGIFNRSHYEDVLVVRVHELVPEEVWSKRYEQINNFEKMLSENGTIILKFFLHVSRDEQKERLRERVEDKTKNWKFNAGDLAERDLWDKYTEAYEDALYHCSTEWAPWYVVPANQKWYRNYIVGTVLIDALKRLKMKYPQPDLSGVVVE